MAKRSPRGKAKRASKPEKHQQPKAVDRAVDDMAAALELTRAEHEFFRAGDALADITPARAAAAADFSDLDEVDEPAPRSLWARLLRTT